MEFIYLKNLTLAVFGIFSFTIKQVPGLETMFKVW